MKRSVKKEYEYKRSYDYADCNTHVGKKFAKKRAHKRLRKQLKSEEGDDSIEADKAESEPQESEK